MFQYLPPKVKHFLNWELPQFLGTQYDGTETFNPFSSPFNRIINAAWHAQSDSIHHHTIQYRIIKAISDNDINELKLALDQNPQSITNKQYEFTPLSLAASLNRTALIDYLILRGAPLDQIDDQGRTPLIQAVINWQIEAIKILTERGAQIDIKGKYGYNAIELAQLRGYEQITKFLQSQNNRKIRFNYPKFELTFKIEEQIAKYEQIIEDCPDIVFETKKLPFNNYSGLYQINLL